MNISQSPITITCPEYQVYEPLLSLDGKQILELGCGKAELTRQITDHGINRYITATEVDEIQHNKNLQIDDLPNVNFVLAGSQAIPFPDNSFDVVMMFKSFHHVPIELMGQALAETRRVLKPGGLAYISEPLFSGDFNDVLKLFHDEKAVRDAAFAAIKKCVDKGELSLKEELFFNTPIVFEDFAQFETNVINVTHSDHKPSKDIHQQVERLFMNNEGPDGFKFHIPIRVDLLQKPA